MSQTLKDRVVRAPSRGAIAGVFPLSFAQESLWLHEQIIASSAYNMPEAWHLRGPLDVALLRFGLDAMVARHETLRTVFRKEQGNISQVVFEAAPCFLEERFFPSGHLLQLEEILAQESAERFDIESGPLFRVLLYRISSENHVLLLNFHHLIADAWSQRVFMEELASLYSAASGDPEKALPELPIQFGDFAAWQREAFQGGRMDEQLGFWKQQLQGAPPPISLPSDLTPTEPEGGQTSITGFYSLDRELVDALSEVARSRHVTVFAVLLSAFKVLLNRYTGEEDIIVGSPIAGRERVETERLIGLFVNTHAIRTSLASNPTFSELLDRVRESSLGAMAHQDVSISQILQATQPDRTGGHPLFRVVFGLQTEPGETLSMHGLTLHRIEVANRAGKFDWTLLLSRTAAGISIRSEHRAGLYREETVRRRLKHYEMLLRGVVDNPNRRISDYDLSSREERQLILHRFNDTRSEYERDATVHERFSDLARWHPDRIALASGENRLTYAEVEQRSDRVGAALQSAGLEPGACVIVDIPRSPALIIGLLGVLKAGGIYVPLDPSYPAKLREQIMKQTRSKILLTNDTSPGQAIVPGMIRVEMETAQAATWALRPVPAGPEAAAYVMFTSGSTGMPKGVVVSHRAILRLVRNTNYVRITGNDVFLQLAPSAFDASTFEIWGALLNGARLAIMPPGMPSLNLLGETIRREGVTILWLTAGLFNEMIDAVPGALGGVKQLLTGGEALSVPHVLKGLRALPNTTLINGYGPTENTTFSCCYAIPADWEPRSTVPIGVPVSNSKAYVLDPEFKLCPIGLPGELFVAGDGLGIEYLGSPELTEEKFIQVSLEPDAPKIRMYRTGDAARWLEDGTVEFLGRIDRQIKIRGFRIEPAEIESVLVSHPGIRSALVVCLQRPTGKQLVAYFVPCGPAPESEELSRFCASRLPLYMVPVFFVALDRLPLTVNGKVNRSALPEPAESRASDGTCLAPETEAEQKVAAVWQEVFGRNGFDVRQDFFQLGGHSLLATQVASRLSQMIGADVPVAAVFENPTIRSMAAALPTIAVRGESTPLDPLRPTRRAGDVLKDLEALSDTEIERLLKDFEASAD